MELSKETIEIIETNSGLSLDEILKMDDKSLKHYFEKRTGKKVRWGQECESEEIEKE